MQLHFEQPRLHSGSSRAEQLTAQEQKRAYQRSLKLSKQWPRKCQRNFMFSNTAHCLECVMVNDLIKYYIWMKRVSISMTPHPGEWSTSGQDWCRALISPPHSSLASLLQESGLRGQEHSLQLPSGLYDKRERFPTISENQHLRPSWTHSKKSKLKINTFGTLVLKSSKKNYSLHFSFYEGLQ